MTGIEALAPEAWHAPVCGRPEWAAALLGGCSITLAGCPVDTTASRRPRTLLAYLLVHRVAARDVLMDQFLAAFAARRCA